jgi:hypothetical protein
MLVRSFMLAVIDTTAVTASTATHEQTKEAVAAAISAKEGEYIDNLLRMFDDCEDLDDTDSLR